MAIFTSWNANQMKLSMTIKKIVFGVVVMFVVLAPASLVFAAPGGVVNTDPVPLNFAPPCIPVQGISGLDTCASPLTSASTIQDYIIRLYQFSVGISGIVAVGMIVWGAIKISAFTESITQKSEGREMITNAVIGIVLLLGSYLILRTVNPRIVSLGEMLSPATVPQNTSATSSLAAAPESCGDADKIVGVEGVPIGNVKPDDGGNTCKYRKLFIYKDGFHIVPDNDFYMSSTNIDIKPLSVIWTYPYFVKGKGSSSARCVVYAYREPGNPGATFSSLEPGIEPCILTGKQLDGYAGGPSSTTSTTNVPENIKALANQLFGGSIQFSSSNDCSPAGSAAYNVITSMQNGSTPFVCHNGCKTDGVPCAQTGAYPSAAILSALKSLKDQNISATVTSLTGGDHAAGSAHYTGDAVDIISNGGITAYNNIITKLNAAGIYAYCEYFDTAYNAVKLHRACGSGIGSPQNLHIHAQTSPNGNAIP